MITLNKLKSFLEISPKNTTKDELLADCIRGATAELCGLVNRELQRKSHLETFNGNGCKFGYLKNYPVASVSTLQISAPEGFSDLLVPPDTISDSLLIFDAGIIFLKKGYTFPAGEMNIYVEYESGYTPVDNWAPDTRYNVGDVVIYNGKLFECVMEHISDAEFHKEYWSETKLAAVPADIEKAVKYLAAKQFYDSPAGKNLLMKKAESTTAAYSKSIVYRDIEIEVIINKYRKLNI
jgi:hypothetical protein